jgi:hypothetical protein
MLNENIIEEIPTYGVYMDMEMNVGGQFQGTYQLDQTGKDNESLIAASIPGRTWVAVERNDVCVWFGFVWSRVYSAQSKSLQLFAQSFEKIPTKRIITYDMNYITTEQRNIFRDLWINMQTGTNCNVNVNVPSAFSTVVTKDLTGFATDYKYYDEAMTQITDAVDGFDWYISVVKDGYYYRKDLTIGYPTIGVSQANSTIVFEYPGNITQYYETEGMTDAGTNVFVFGGGEGSTMNAIEANDPNLFAQGWPRWDVDVTRKDVAAISDITQISNQLLQTRKPPMIVIKITVKANLEPVFGSYSLGDACRIVIKDARNPTTFDQYKRLLKWQLHPASSDSVEEVDLIFEGDSDV